MTIAAIPSELATALTKSIGSGDLEHASDLVEHESTPVLVETLGRLNATQRAVAFRLLGKDQARDVFEDLPPVIQGELIQALRESEVATIFEELDPDDRVWLLEELPSNLAPRLLRGLSRHEAAMTASVLGYPEDAIGRRMSPEFVSVHPWMTVGEAIQRVTRHFDDAETIYVMPVTDKERRVQGIVTLRDLLAAHPSDSVEPLVLPAITAEATEDDETAARRATANSVLAMPIVDSENRLVGILTIDDAIKILDREHAEDAARQGGAEPLHRPYLSTPITSIVRSRVVWLLVLALGATLTVHVLEIFESTLEQVTALALFVPLLIGTGGNTGNQAATTVTRALSLDEVEPRDILRVLGREARVGMLLGLGLGLLGFAVTGIIYSLSIGLVIGLTLLTLCTVAATIGGVMPIIARAIGVDPAVFSNPFISTFVDSSGLIIYFMIAKAILGL